MGCNVDPRAQAMREKFGWNGAQPSANGSGGKAKPSKRARDRWQTLNEFCDFHARRFNPTTQAVWLQLFRETKPNGTATASYGQIAEKIGRQREAVRRSIETLKAQGYVAVLNTGCAETNKPATYAIQLPEWRP